jgi:hypothetical protein
MARCSVGGMTGTAVVLISDIETPLLGIPAGVTYAGLLDVQRGRSGTAIPVRRYTDPTGRGHDWPPGHLLPVRICGPERRRRSRIEVVTSMSAPAVIFPWSRVSPSPVMLPVSSMITDAVGQRTTGVARTGPPRWRWSRVSRVTRVMSEGWTWSWRDGIALVPGVGCAGDDGSALDSSVPCQTCSGEVPDRGQRARHSVTEPLSCTCLAGDSVEGHDVVVHRGGRTDNSVRKDGVYRVEAIGGPLSRSPRGWSPGWPRWPRSRRWPRCAGHCATPSPCWMSRSG